MLLELDFSSQTPIYQQIRNQIVLAVAEGRLQDGQRIPSVRTLADESGINMMTVNKAYQLLRHEGYLQIDRRSGARISIPAHFHPVSSNDQDLAAVAAMTNLRPQLELLISEARLHGVSQETFLSACRDIFHGQKEV